MKSKKSKKSKKPKKGGSCGAMSELMGGAGKQMRSFKVISVNGKDYPHKGGIYHGKEPLTAARKAGRWACDKLGHKTECKIRLVLKEATRGSSKREFGPYEYHKSKLAKPIEKKIGKTTVMQKWKTKVSKVSVAKK